MAFVFNFEMDTPMDEIQQQQLKTINYDPNTKRRRHKASQRQIDTLEASFVEDAKPCREAQESLAVSLSMSLRSVQIWFQNRRAKARLAGQVLPPRPLHWKQPLVGNQENKPLQAESNPDQPLVEAAPGSRTESTCASPSEPHSEPPSELPSELHGESPSTKETTPEVECPIVRHAGLVTHTSDPPAILTGVFSIEHLSAPFKKRPRYYHFIPEYELKEMELRDALEKCIPCDFPKEVLGICQEGCPPPAAYPSSPVALPIKLKPQSLKPPKKRRKTLVRASTLVPLLPKEEAP